MHRRPPISQMFSHMSAIFTEIWGQRYTLTLTDGREISVEGIFRAAQETQQISSHGVDQLANHPHFDIRRHDLLGAGLVEMDVDLHDATVVVNGRNYMLDDIRDDFRALVKTRLIAT